MLAVEGQLDGEHGREHEQVVLALGDLDAVGVAQAEPPLRHRRDLVAVALDRELVVEQVAGHLEVARAGNVDGELVSEGREEVLAYVRRLLAADRHGIRGPQGDEVPLDGRYLLAVGVLDHQAVAQRERLAVDVVRHPPGVVRDVEVVADAEEPRPDHVHDLESAAPLPPVQRHNRGRRLRAADRLRPSGRQRPYPAAGLTAGPHVRCRAKNRFPSSPSNWGTPVCPPILACSVFSFEPKASNRSRAICRSFPSSSHCSRTSSGMMTCRASSRMARGTKLPANRTAAEIRGSTTANRTPMAITPPANPTGPRISGSERRVSRVALHSGTASSTSGRTSRSTISSSTGSPACSAWRRSARACSRAAERGRSPLPGSSMVAAAKPSAAACRARATSRGYIVRSPPGWPSRISGAGADVEPGVHRMPGISPRVNSRSRTASSRRRSEVNCMIMPFGSARERRSRTTYRPTVTPEGSTHVDTFTGTTSSFSRTASRK